VLLGATDLRVYSSGIQAKLKEKRIFPPGGWLGISVGLTKYTNDSLQRVLGTGA